MQAGRFGSKYLSTNILVTAWNDSGGGHLCRLLDGLENTFTFPFEVLLGSREDVGIVVRNDLVKPGYRWNVFRDVESLSIEDRIRLRESGIAEYELNDWLNGVKFSELASYKHQIKRILESSHLVDDRNGELLTVDSVISYIDSLQAGFDRVGHKTRILHVPCAALDIDHPNFFRVFQKVVGVFIHPAIGYGNMKARNKIRPHRYIERWKEVNSSLLDAKRDLRLYADRIILFESNYGQAEWKRDVREVATALTGYTPLEEMLSVPTLIGEQMNVSGYPYGGLLDPYANVCLDLAESVLLDDIGIDMHKMYEECIAIYDSMRRLAVE